MPFLFFCLLLELSHSLFFAIYTSTFCLFIFCTRVPSEDRCIALRLRHCQQPCIKLSTRTCLIDSHSTYNASVSFFFYNPDLFSFSPSRCLSQPVLLFAFLAVPSIRDFH
ncbi:hypothetical protein BZA70DRAFT_270452 [Myxozyma melibiosi]|uniref:Secreted protein n=1 Tax=Myxozyma melibiosi TaxID=54550 RepID=A0ABR1FB52_9ASCO